MSRTRPAWFYDAIVVGAGIVGLLIVWFGNAGGPRPLGFPLDDAWIHMVYGRNLAHDGLLAYNTGVASTGATSPLWALVVAAAHLLGGGSVDATVVLVYLFGCAFHIATTVLVARLVLALTNQRAVAVAAGVITAFSGALAASAFSGMEVSLTAALLLAAILACVRERWPWAGLWLALAALARPEAVVVSACCFGYAAWTTRALPPLARVKRLARLTWPSLAFGALIVVFALWATGRPLPATFYMKQQGSLADLPSRFRVAIGGLLGDVTPLQTGLAYLSLTGLVLPGLLRPDGPRGRLLLPAIAAVAFLTANLALIPPAPGVFYHLRYLLPAVPLLVVVLVLGTHQLGRLGSLAATWRRYIPLGVLCMLALFETSTSIGVTSRRLHNDTRNIEEVQRTVGVWLDKHTAPDAWVATGDAGAIRYFGKRQTVDVMGLNTPELYWDAKWVDAHAVAAFALIPCWFRPRSSRGLSLVMQARTEGYTVTKLECMREQIVVTCAQPGRFEFEGMRDFGLQCAPAGLREETPP
jgi:hypothetical protein